MPQILPMSIPVILIILIFSAMSLIVMNETKWKNNKKYMKKMMDKKSKMYFLSLFIS
uniref:ATP synthase subunit 8 n=1 Tax=Thrips alatus TaxID=1030670 RepID=UPI0030DF5DB1